MASLPPNYAHYYLLNTEEHEDRRCKLILSQTDNASLKAILDQQPRPQEYSLRVEKTSACFKNG
jgi:hypothetical protein